MSDYLNTALLLGVPCFFSFTLVIIAISNWELNRESMKNEGGLPIATDTAMVIVVLIVSFFVSLTLVATGALIGLLDFTIAISVTGHIILGILTGCISALLILLKDIIDMTLFIGEPKGTWVIRMGGAFAPPVVIPILASMLSNI